MPDTELKTYSNSNRSKKYLRNIFFFHPSLPTSSGVKIHNCVISSLYNRSQDSYQVEYGLVEIKIGITEPFANDNHDGSTMFVHSSYVNAVRSFLNITTKLASPNKTIELSRTTSDKSASSDWACNSSNRIRAASFSVRKFCIVHVVEVVVVGLLGEPRCIK